MPTIGLLRRLPPVEPWNGTEPILKMPPSAATSQYPTGPDGPLAVAGPEVTTASTPIISATPAVGRDPPPHEHLDESSLLYGDDEVGRQCDVHPEPRGRAVHGGDDRLLAVEDGVDQPLGAVADQARRVAHDPLGSLGQRWRGP